MSANRSFFGSSPFFSPKRAYIYCSQTWIGPCQINRAAYTAAAINIPMPVSSRRCGIARRRTSPFSLWVWLLSSPFHFSLSNGTVFNNEPLDSTGGNEWESAASHDPFSRNDHRKKGVESGAARVHARAGSASWDEMEAAGNGNDHNTNNITPSPHSCNCGIHQATESVSI